MSSNQLLQTIKIAAVEAVEAANPCAVVYGTVKKTAPLTIAVDQKITLTSVFLAVTQTAKDTISTGDKVVMVRVQGGQQYLVIDKVVSV